MLIAISIFPTKDFQEKIVYYTLFLLSDTDVDNTQTEDRFKM